MGVIRDTLIMAKRSLRHTFRSMDTIITVVATPVAMMLMFVFIFNGLFDTGSVKPINYVTPGIMLMCVVSGIAYTAFRLNNDIQKGIINRFKTMPVAPSSILGGHAISSVLSNLFSVLIVLLAALLVGFQSSAGVVEWLIFSGLLLLFTVAATWLAIVFGLLAKTAEGAGAFSYIFLLLLFVSPAFILTEKLNPVVRAFAENQPITPIIETMRSLLTNGTAGDSAWIAALWCVGLLAVSYVFAMRIYKTKTI
jgi:ABC-2 type transport system permease protein